MNLLYLLDDDKCFEVIRAHRWPEERVIGGHQIPGARRNVIQEASLDESDTTCLIVLPNRLGTRLPPFFGALLERLYG